MTYKGYSARPEYSAEDGVFFGRLLGINDLVNFESENVEGLEEEFHKAVDDYLALCSEIGKQPETPNAERERKIAEWGAAVLTAAPCICKVWRER